MRVRVWAYAYVCAVYVVRVDVVCLSSHVSERDTNANKANTHVTHKSTTKNRERAHDTDEIQTLDSGRHDTHFEHSKTNKKSLTRPRQRR